MSSRSLALLVAGRGSDEDQIGGLYRYDFANAAWTGRKLATVTQLSSLAHHPTLPVLYGTSGVGEAGRLHAWRIDRDEAVPLIELDSGGSEPCHVAVHPQGTLLVVANYTSGTLASCSLDEQGRPNSPLTLVELDGEGNFAEPDRQSHPHPHQVVFSGHELLVPDLGSDTIRRFALTSGGIGPQIGARAVPDGTGPRHLGVIPEGLVVSGELSETFAVLTDDHLTLTPSTTKTGAAASRPPRNYPGDLQVDPRRQVAFLANRGYDSITALRWTDRRVIGEFDSGVKWPQHLLIDEDRLYVAGWDDSRVASLPIGPDGALGTPEICFECPGAAWLVRCDDHCAPGFPREG